MPAPEHSPAVPPLLLGTMRIWPPVVLAPMAGVTDAAFRSLCRRYGGGLYVSEMLHAGELLRGRARSRDILRFSPEESPRSVQLYGTEPASLAEATRLLVGEHGVEHLDLNFGCPVRKVTASGGGSAVPARPRLLARLVRAVVEAAGSVPVTIKVRAGLDEDHLSYRSSAEVAASEGCAAIGLHARTTAQLYDGPAHWQWIADLVSHAKIPVLGNGDIWVAKDALRMMRETHCAGVIVGRGCLGRPWLFRDIEHLFEGRTVRARPRLGEARDVLLEHLHALITSYGTASAMLRIRKFLRWYLGDYPDTATVLSRLSRAQHLGDLEIELAALDGTLEASPESERRARGKAPGRQRVSLPEGWLDDPDADAAPASALHAEGG